MTGTVAERVKGTVAERGAVTGMVTVKGTVAERVSDYFKSSHRTFVHLSDEGAERLRRLRTQETIQDISLVHFSASEDGRPVVRCLGRSRRLRTR